MKRTDFLDFESAEFLEQRLYLRAVFTHDVEIVAACLAGPSFGVVEAQGSELSECVGGEQDLLFLLVFHDDLGPVDHAGGKELESVLAERKGGVVLYGDDALRGHGLTEETGHHLDAQCGADYLHLGVLVDHLLDERGVVGFHVAHDEIVGLAVAEHFG